MKTLFLLLAVFPLSAFATPQKIEMIFLSQGKMTQLIQQLDEMNSEKVISKLAQGETTYQDNCIPMGEGCFHPQYGYLNRKPVISGTTAAAPVKKQDEKKEESSAQIQEPEVKLKTFNAVETSMVNCEKGNYFDIFCGKEKGQGKFAEIEIWFDVSSSFRAIDYNRDPNYCNRRTFLTKMKEACKDKVSAYVFNTSIKQLGDLSGVCLSHGSNDEAKLLQWIKDSQAKTLLIVTDVEEMSKSMRDFLDSKGAKYTGEMKPFTSTDLANYAKEFSKVCKK